MKTLFGLLLPLFFIIALLIFLAYMKVNPFKPNSTTANPSPSPTASQSPAPESYKIPILLYHYVEVVKDPKDTIRQKLDITPQVFEKQIMTLKENGYETLFMKEVSEIINNTKTSPNKPIAITFDDGYKDFYTDVFPLLKKYNIRATVYIIYSFLDKPNYMTKDEVKEILASNLVEIGSHTMTHPNLTKAKNAQAEVVDSKSSLEELTGSPVISFAYPYGSNDSKVIELVKSTGYKTSVTVKEGIATPDSNPLTLPRLRPGNRSGNDLLSFVSKKS